MVTRLTTTSERINDGEAEPTGGSSDQPGSANSTDSLQIVNAKSKQSRRWSAVCRLLAPVLENAVYVILLLNITSYYNKGKHESDAKLIEYKAITNTKSSPVELKRILSV
eukprot:scaffold267428_cov33-Prasinocladus_malaysianus.AAC.2